jgi:hypothetical protein
MDQRGRYTDSMKEREREGLGKMARQRRGEKTGGQKIRK